GDEQPVIDVFPDRQTQHIARLDGVGSEQACTLESCRKAERRRHACDSVNTVVYSKNEGIALLEYRTRKDFISTRPRTREPTGGNDGQSGEGGHGAASAQGFGPLHAI